MRTAACVGRKSQLQPRPVATSAAMRRSSLPMTPQATGHTKARPGERGTFVRLSQGSRAVPGISCRPGTLPHAALLISPRRCCAAVLCPQPRWNADGTLLERRYTSCYTARYTGRYTSRYTSRRIADLGVSGPRGVSARGVSGRGGALSPSQVVLRTTSLIVPVRSRSCAAA